MRNPALGAAARIRQHTVTWLAAGLLCAVAVALPIAASPAAAATPLVPVAHSGHGGFILGDGGFHGGHVGGHFDGNAGRPFVRHGFEHRFHPHDRSGWGWCGPWDGASNYPYDYCW